MVVMGYLWWHHGGTMGIYGGNIGIHDGNMGLHGCTRGFHGGNWGVKVVTCACMLTLLCVVLSGLCSYILWLLNITIYAYIDIFVKNIDI
jgi:hypothetical protein